MSEQGSVNRPPDTIELNGHRYVSEHALAMWGTIEIMVRNPAVSERISDLELRLATAEAERDAAHNEALEKAAKEIDCGCNGRDIVLSPDVRSNSRERWDACGESNCCALAALDIRMLKKETPNADK
jgi:hypothetical protein